jgi:hypothetical protein
MIHDINFNARAALQWKAPDPSAAARNKALCQQLAIRLDALITVKVRLRVTVISAGKRPLRFLSLEAHTNFLIRSEKGHPYAADSAMCCGPAGSLVSFM